jgi:C-terminal processing protease CtpA/Prc
VLVNNTPENIEILGELGVTYTQDSEKFEMLSSFHKEDFTPGPLVTQITLQVEPEFSEGIFKGKIYALSDMGLTSSSAGFAMFCKNTGFATLVGSNSKGDGGGFNPIYTALPRSGLVMVNRVSYTLNEDGSCNAEVGTAPDIYSPAGEEPLDTVMNMLAGK